MEILKGFLKNLNLKDVKKNVCKITMHANSKSHNMDKDSWHPQWAPVISSMGHMTWILKVMCHIIRVTVYTKDNVHNVLHS